MIKDTLGAEFSVYSKLNSSFLVVGLVRDCEKKIRADVLRLKSAIGKTKQLHWLLIESDSTDNTISTLAKLSNDVENFRYISLGTLRKEMPLRTERISHCRNLYVKEIRHNSIYNEIDYVVVSDFDGINTHIDQSAIESCWSRKDWDMCAANQLGPYYDIWALRHKDWSPNDCFAQYRFLNTYEPNQRKNLYASVYSRMINIPISSEWIEVDSAFGGLAIYKKRLFDIGEYVGLNEKGEELCEHVHLHAQLKRSGAKFFINPQLINAKYTEHTRHLLLSKSVILKSKNIVKRFLNFMIGKDRIIAQKKTEVSMKRLS